MTVRRWTMLKQGEMAALQVHAHLSRSCVNIKAAALVEHSSKGFQSRLGESNFKNDALVVTVININQMRSGHFLSLPVLITMIWLSCTFTMNRMLMVFLFFLRGVPYCPGLSWSPVGIFFFQPHPPFFLTI